MIKYYYANKLASQNFTAKPNLVWVADCTSLNLGIFPKINLFICIDIHTNTVIATKMSKKVVQAKQVISALSKAIEKRFTRKLHFYNVSLNVGITEKH